MKTIKALLKGLLVACIATASVIIIGCLPSVIISGVVHMVSDRITFSDCADTAIFWVISIMGWIFSCYYVGDIFCALDKEHKESFKNRQTS